MSENGSNTSGGLSHGPGSFTHNNAAELPGQGGSAQDTTKGQFENYTRDEVTKAEHAAAQKTETERRHEMTQPVVTYASFKAQRQQQHQPAPELSYETPLPYRTSVDAAKFNDQQLKTHQQAMKDQPVSAAKGKDQGSGSHLEPMTKGTFLSKRFAQLHQQTQSKDKSR